MDFQAGVDQRSISDHDRDLLRASVSRIGTCRLSKSLFVMLYAPNPPSAAFGVHHELVAGHGDEGRVGAGFVGDIGDRPHFAGVQARDRKFARSMLELGSPPGLSIERQMKFAPAAIWSLIICLDAFDGTRVDRPGERHQAPWSTGRRWTRSSTSVPGDKSRARGHDVAARRQELHETVFASFAGLEIRQAGPA